MTNSASVLLRGALCWHGWGPLAPIEKRVTANHCSEWSPIFKDEPFSSGVFLNENAPVHKIREVRHFWVWKILSHAFPVTRNQHNWRPVTDFQPTCSISPDTSPVPSTYTLVSETHLKLRVMKTHFHRMCIMVLYNSLKTSHLLILRQPISELEMSVLICAWPSYISHIFTYLSVACSPL